MPKPVQKKSAHWPLYGSYAILIVLALLSSAFIPDAALRTGMEEGVADMVGPTRIIFVLIPCLLAGNLAFLGFLFYEKHWNQRKLFTIENFNHSILHCGFLILTVISFSIGN